MTRIQRVTLTNRNNMQLELCNYGARIISIRVPNAKGKLIETTLSDRLNQDILNDTAFKGATCGRVANRIAEAKFLLEGQSYKLDANEAGNMLHGGTEGFSQQFWHIESHQKSYARDKLVLVYYSKHGECGFPGNMTTKVCYELNHDNQVIIHFQAQSDRLTPVNLCNHTYFTMGEKDIKALKLRVNASSFLETDKASIPTGRMLPVSKKTSWLNEKTIGEMLASRDFDDCFVLNKSRAFDAELCSEQHGLRLKIQSNHQGLQIYTGNHLTHKHAAIALEAQGFPDALNHPHFLPDYVGPKRPYSKYLTYTFESL